MERCISSETTPKPFLKTVPAEGLCGACENVVTCALRARSAGPVLHCEEFQGAPPRERSASDHQAPAISVAMRVGVLGLCANCARFDACALPRPEAGVWQCEEYC